MPNALKSIMMSFKVAIVVEFLIGELRDVFNGCHYNVLQWRDVYKGGYYNYQRFQHINEANRAFCIVFAIDPYHGAAILVLKRGWTGINNELIILCILKMACVSFMSVQPRFKFKMAAA